MKHMKLKYILPILCFVLAVSAFALTSCRGSVSDDSASNAAGSAEDAGSAVVTGGVSEEETIDENASEEPNDIPEGDKYIALTFDDGPTGNEDGLTEQLLDGLKERGAHATFFLCGYRVEDYNSMMERYLAEGHEIGNHTMDHTRMDEEEDGGLSQVQTNNELIESYTGETPTLVRPVGGAYNDDVLEAMKSLDLPIILWNLDTVDWKYKDAETVKNKIIEQAEDGAIILAHDLYETSIEGALAAIDELQAQGYSFVTVSELARVKNVTLEGGQVYKDFTYATLHPEAANDDYPTEEESEDLPGIPEGADPENYPGEDDTSDSSAAGQDDDDEVINDTIDDNEDGIPDSEQ